MILTGGQLVSLASGNAWWPTSASTYDIPLSVRLGDRWSTYGAFYESLPWVAVCVNKRANGAARLPLVVYRRGADGRTREREHPYARLLARPNPRYDRFRFWAWTTSTYDVYGEAMWAKSRQPDGRVVGLWPMHPIHTRVKVDKTTGAVTYVFRGSGTDVDIPEADVVHFRRYNPEDSNRGLSPLEPLRSTLENEDGARRANSSFWSNGARPGFALKHPGNLSQPAAERLKLQWNAVAGGASNTGATVVLEEGMHPEVLSLTAEEAQYIETHKLTSTTTCAIYDIPPTVVGILDHATFSNVTEQLRSFYRDTMAPLLGYFESVLDHDLRPEFEDTDDIYAEFLMDEVLRGAFEDRAIAIQAAINSGQMTPNEGRSLDNRPAMPGGDQLLVNSTMVPLATGESNAMTARQLAEAIQKIYLGVGEVITADEAREILNREGAGLTGPGPVALPAPAPSPSLPSSQVRSLMGRISRAKSLDDIDQTRLTEGMNGSSTVVLSTLTAAKAAGEDVDGLRGRLKDLEAPEEPLLVLAKAIASQPAPVNNVNVTTPDVHVDAPVTVEAQGPRTKTVERDAGGNITQIVEG